MDVSASPSFNSNSDQGQLSTNSEKQGASPHLVAIASGAVCGVVLLAAVVASAFLYHRRIKFSAQTASNGGGASNPNPTNPPTDKASDVAAVDNPLDRLDTSAVL
jgi:hypothetical protein